MRDYTTLHVSPLIEFLALRAIENLDSLLAPRLDQARRNRSIFQQWVIDHSEEVTAVMPAGGVAAFPRFPHLAQTDTLAQLLLDKYRVLVIPGSCFGHAQHLRVGFGGPTSELVEGLSRLSEALRSGAAD